MPPKNGTSAHDWHTSNFMNFDLTGDPPVDLLFWPNILRPFGQRPRMAGHPKAFSSASIEDGGAPRLTKRTSRLQS